MKKIISIVLLFYFMFNLVSSSTAAVAGASTGAAYQRQLEESINQSINSRCLPPTKFSQENNCPLEYTRYVNQFNCGQYIITSDCNGTIINIFDTYEQAKKDNKIFIGFLAIVLILFLIYKIKTNFKIRKRKKMKDDTTRQI